MFHLRILPSNSLRILPYIHTPVVFQMFPDAEKAFTQVLKLDKNCEDAVQELLRVRTHQIMVCQIALQLLIFFPLNFAVVWPE